MISEAEITSAPAAEPLSLTDAKAHLRVDFTDDDALITAQIKAARRQVEAFTRNALITQTVQWTWDAFPSTLSLPIWPVQSISSVGYTDGAGADQTLAASKYTLIKSKPRRIGPAYSETWPTTRLHWNAVRVSAVVGYGDAGSDVPEDIMAALKLILAALYENREDTLVGVSASDLPGMASARSLLRPHVLWL